MKRVLLVDIDPEMTRLARENPEISALNQGSLRSPLVEVRNEDAFAFIRASREVFDIAIVDFPDPHNFAIGKLYSTHFFRALKARLDPSGGVASVQTTSPLNARRSFWCIHQTLEAAGFAVRPLHALVPSFGEWGYALASTVERPEPVSLIPGLRYLDSAALRSLFAFGPDLARIPVEINRLNNQALVRYYQEELAAWP